MPPVVATISPYVVNNTHSSQGSLTRSFSNHNIGTGQVIESPTRSQTLSHSYERQDIYPSQSGLNAQVQPPPDQTSVTSHLNQRVQEPAATRQPQFPLQIHTVV